MSNKRKYLCKHTHTHTYRDDESKFSWIWHTHTHNGIQKEKDKNERARENCCFSIIHMFTRSIRGYLLLFMFT